MKRLLAAGAVALATTLALAGCSGDSPGLEGAHAEWGEAMVSGGTYETRLGAMWAPLADSSGYGALDGVINIGIEDERYLGTIEMHCTGVDTATFHIRMAAADSTMVYSREVSCADSPLVVEEAPRLVEGLAAMAGSDAGDGAWAVIFHRAEAP
ncbi:hypothetical protein [Microbacterium sp. NIBRBAC000506063]|uniref:hypothetical protein n=1 Tax=Microbacterium sp. NIBRBAC000506063 TaxID=2734618 RepID=UPI001BB52F32|nr:hypothetical protein [Microbacterium sp. NIBRBAC000506063]QTV79385.1 hypothetical protein KAE78_10530 [Microbacterium sp. NIBRBAC000506063]